MRVYDGASNLEELHRRMQPFTIRRRKHGLPPRTVEICVVPPTDGALLERELKTYDSWHAAKLRGETVPFNAMAAARIATAKAKLPACIAEVRRALEEDGCAVAFAAHHAVIDALFAAFPGSAVIDGAFRPISAACL
jgi:hypothetical protein